MIWLIGNKGMLGTELSEALERAGLPFIGTDREVSILDKEALANFAAGKDIQWIINCAAYTAVDKAEDEAELCRDLNVRGPDNIAQCAEKIGAALLHISTDYVFSGEATEPYTEEAPHSPTGVYGKTKAEGESVALAVCTRCIILRTAWLYGRHGPNFVYTMLRLMKEKESIGVVADQKGSPTWARNLADAIIAIITSSQPSYGIFQYTNLGETNWHDFAVEIKWLGRSLGILEKDCQIKSLATSEYPTKARRPAYSVLSKDKIQATYQLHIPLWKESLEMFLQEEKSKKYI